MGQVTQRQTTEPWTINEINRIMMSARTMPEAVGSIPGKHWWPSLLLLIMDLDVSAETVVQLPTAAFHPRSGQISCGGLTHELHALTLEALQTLPSDRKRLIPWPKDSLKPPFQMLFRDYKTVLFRAGLPYSRRNSFARLQVTARRHHGLLDYIEPVLGFTPLSGKPQLLRARDRRRLAVTINKATRPLEPSSGSPLGPTTQPFRKGLILPTPISCTEDPTTLQNVFRSKYRPTVLRQSSESTVRDYERVILLAYSFAGRELTFPDLTDELLEAFLYDCLDRGASPATCNKYVAMLNALWRFGWRKRFTNDQPRDVHKLRVDRQLPEAWTPAEMERLISAALRLPDRICDIPARIWWPAFILTLYDTGLRFNALMLRPTTDLNMQTGWLNVDSADQKQKKAQAFKLHSDTLRLIEQMMPADRPALFPWPYRCNSIIRDRYRAILIDAGLPSTKRDLFHKIRRTSATSLAIASDETTASHHLGHSSISVTRRYLDCRQIQPVAAADLISRPKVLALERGS